MQTCDVTLPLRPMCVCVCVGGGGLELGCHLYFKHNEFLISIEDTDDLVL